MRGILISTDPKTESAVIATIDRMTQAYAKRNAPAVLATCDQDFFMYGTGVDEKRVGLRELQAQCERDWSQTESAQLVLGVPRVQSLGDVAWVAADLTFRLKADGESNELSGRGTFVLVKRGAEWRIAQLHASLPAAEQAPGESWPA